MTAACPTVVWSWPMFMNASCVEKSTPRPANGSHSERSTRSDCRVASAQANTTRPPIAIRIQPRRSGGASSSPALIATALPPHNAARSTANAPDSGVSSPRVAGAASGGGVESLTIRRRRGRR